MFTIAAIPITCWLCALIALPRRPLPDNEVQEIVYSRLLGRQRLLALFALLVTGTMFLAFVSGLPQRIDPDLREIRNQEQLCSGAGAIYEQPVCWKLQPGGIWALEIYEFDGRWRIIDTPPAPAIGPANDPAPSTKYR